MTILESEYIKITNRVKITTALRILSGVRDGDGYGVYEEEIRDIRRKLSNIQDRLYGAVTVL